VATPAARLLLAILAVTAMGSSAKPPPMALLGTPLVVSVPERFEHDAAVHGEHPMLHFRRRLSHHGTIPAYPEISIEEVSAHRTPGSLDSYVNDAIARSGTRVVFGPKARVVAGQPARELATLDTVIFCAMDGEDATGELVFHEIVFAYGDHFYSCRLHADPEEYREWVPTLRSFCRSVRFDAGSD
jgi:hypothetical protein